MHQGHALFPPKGPRNVQPRCFRCLDITLREQSTWKSSSQTCFLGIVLQQALSKEPLLNWKRGLLGLFWGHILRGSVAAHALQEELPECSECDCELQCKMWAASLPPLWVYCRLATPPTLAHAWNWYHFPFSVVFPCWYTCQSFKVTSMSKKEV